jgi:hypothetical protein
VSAYAETLGLNPKKPKVVVICTSDPAATLHLSLKDAEQLRWSLAEIFPDPDADAVIAEHNALRQALVYVSAWNGDFRAARDRARQVLKNVRDRMPAPAVAVDRLG